MQFLDLTLPNAAENLALDEALLLQCESTAGPEVLRTWECTSPAVILGAGGMLTLDVDEVACLNDGVPILRRSSGGGTVLLGAGCLQYTLVLAYDRAPELRHIGPSYCHLLTRICEALAVPGLQPSGTSDLALDTQKVSGNAQQRKRDYLLHHGTLLYAFDRTKAGRYLRLPVRQPAYRQQRADAEFLTNLPLGRAEIVSCLKRAFAVEGELGAWPADLVSELVSAKYALAEWTRRR